MVNVTFTPCPTTVATYGPTVLDDAATETAPNVGIDNKGLVVGRNTTIKEGQSYQKVPIHDIIKGYGDKV